MADARLGGPPRDIQQGCDVQVGEELALGCMVGTSKVEERKDFNWAALEAGAEDKQEILDQPAHLRKQNNPDLFVLRWEVPCPVSR